jgi:hypothetical protein
MFFFVYFTHIYFMHPKPDIVPHVDTYSFIYSSLTQRICADAIFYETDMPRGFPARSAAAASLAGADFPTICCPSTMQQLSSSTLMEAVFLL